MAPLDQGVGLQVADYYFLSKSFRFDNNVWLCQPR